jgi:hypothetical protein
VPKKKGRPASSQTGRRQEAELLTGTLDDFSLPEIFRLISSAERTGRVDVARSGGNGSVYFKDGAVCYAESSLSQELPDTDAGDLKAALKRQIEAAVFDLLRWKEGDFRWDSGAEFEAKADLSLHIDDVVAEASRKLEELEVISTKIPSEAAVLVMAPTPPEGAAEINITPEEWRVLVLVNGLRSVTEIATLAGMDTFSVLRVLFELCEHELIALAGDDQPAEAKSEPTDAAAEESETEAVRNEASDADDHDERENKDGSAAPNDAEAEFAPVAEGPPSEISPEAVEATLPEPSVDRTAAVRELAGLFDHADG